MWKLFAKLAELFPSARKLAELLTYLGVLALGLCILATAIDEKLPRRLLQPYAGTDVQKGAKKGVAGDQVTTPATAVPKDDDCDRGLAEELKPESKSNADAAPTDKAGRLRVVGVWPRTVRLGGTLCLVIAGVAPETVEKLSSNEVEAKLLVVNNLKDELATATAQEKVQKQKDLATALAQAIAAQNQPTPTVDVTLFLNGLRSPLTKQASAIYRPQMVTYTFGQMSDANSTDATFWRNLLGSVTTQAGALPLKVGVSRSQSSGSEAEAPGPIEFRLYWPTIVGVGALAMALLSIAFAIFATKSTILRDHPMTNIQLAKYNAKIAEDDLAKAPANDQLKAAKKIADEQVAEWSDKPGANDAAGTFSLGRAQMALWLALSVAGFVFVWLTLGFYKNVITEAVLVLLGINSATGLAAVVMDRDDPSQPPEKKAKSVGFWADLGSDGDGAKLQRIQMIAWTGILAVIFVWNVIANFVFVQFDTYLLLLMGIVNTTYLGFKTQESKDPKPAPPQQ
jgi:hypothetical protein